MFRKPRDDEIDSYGLTHPGLVRPSNQDHFLIGQLRQRFHVKQSSLPDFAELPVAEERIASLMMVADGVGGGQKGEMASRLALEELTQYITESVRCYYSADSGDSDFTRALEAGAIKSHHAVIERGTSDPDSRGMATTLTLWIGVWPWCYLLQVGDSRYYQYRDGKLVQISRDQTMAQELLDSGVFARSIAAGNSPLSNMLSSSIGGHQTAPVVKRLPNSWSTTHLLCSDGLTRHVPDARIAERLREMESARQVCEDLLQDALDGGGTDNITITVGRVIAREGEQSRES
ncbi:MAG TPA: protein phosphatase 2C domain-containing protein [Gemmatimonadaceae bacterium]|nr:protein phosphatase 2C domain-containing protein [Gemmatimonadaceae bacterium]